MLDQEIKKQLMEYFSKIEGKIQFRIFTSNHIQQNELQELLQEVASCSPNLSVLEYELQSHVPKFEILKDGNSTGVSFIGIPGGHEFSSLILAVLNVSGLGQVPDPGLQARMSRLSGHSEVRTFVSLSCENCPDIVQALNQIAIFGKRINHTMVEGSVVQEELAKLNVQGVPAVFVGDKLIHSGRGSLIELLTKLEKELGTSVDGNALEEDLGTFDVAVLGEVRQAFQLQFIVREKV